MAISRYHYLKRLLGTISLLGAVMSVLGHTTYTRLGWYLSPNGPSDGYDYEFSIHGGQFRFARAWYPGARDPVSLTVRFRSMLRARGVRERKEFESHWTGFAWHARLLPTVRYSSVPDLSCGLCKQDLAKLPAVSEITIPLWIILLFCGISSSIWLRDRRRIQPGHCPSCNYNLTGNISGICPECGTAIDATSLHPDKPASAGLPHSHGIE